MNFNVSRLRKGDGVGQREIFNILRNADRPLLKHEILERINSDNKLFNRCCNHREISKSLKGLIIFHFVDVIFLKTIKYFYFVKDYRQRNWSVIVHINRLGLSTVYVFKKFTLKDGFFHCYNAMYFKQRGDEWKVVKEVVLDEDELSYKNLIK